jgi:hypothetical protein
MIHVVLHMIQVFGGVRYANMWTVLHNQILPLIQGIIHGQTFGGAWRGSKFVQLAPKHRNLIGQ